MGTLHVKDLRHGFAPDQPLLRLPDLSLPPGEMTVLSGPSGAGKTTLLYLLSGLLRPDQGQILWGNTLLSTLREAARDRWRHQHAGFVFQDFHLIPELPVLDNVLVPVWFRAFSAARYKPRALALLSRFGVPLRAQARLLSRGEQQRLAVARALICGPKVIFADEPTASLDAASAAGVAQILRAEADAGQSVIIASHDPALIAMADRRLLLAQGHEVRLT